MVEEAQISLWKFLLVLLGPKIQPLIINLTIINLILQNKTNPPEIICWTGKTQKS